MAHPDIEVAPSKANTLRPTFEVYAPCINLRAPGRASGIVNFPHSMLLCGKLNGSNEEESQ